MENPEKADSTEETTMATRNPKHWVSISTESPNRNLSQSAQETLDAVTATSNPRYHVAWTDLYAIFRNSRQMVRETSRLETSADENLRAMVKVLRENHAHLRRLLFLVAIETLFNIGRQNTRELLWIYGDQLEVMDMISEHLAETEEEIAQVQAHFEEAIFSR